MDNSHGEGRRTSQNNFEGKEYQYKRAESNCDEGIGRIQVLDIYWYKSLRLQNGKHIVIEWYSQSH